MNSDALIRRLSGLPAALEPLLRSITPNEAEWKPPSGAWSILEIVNHLADEEVDDFRRRLDLTLLSPGEPWPPIDPEAWARERRYNERELRESAARFLTERRKSLAWLVGLGDVDWTKAHRHPKFGPISAGTLLGSWVAHDALHLRQIAKRLYELSAVDAGPHPIEYAGAWGA
ncbi:MAG TPA: DinB family protein [Phycisphaerae bacterium]|jgi:hypothetical protein